MMQAGTMTGGIMGPLFGGLLAVWFGQKASFIITAVLIFLATTLLCGSRVQRKQQATKAKPSKI